MTETLQYIIQTGTGTASGFGGSLTYNSNDFIQSVQIVRESDKRGVSPQLVFKLIKKKMSFLQERKFTARIKKLEKAFDAAVKNGQDVMAEKILKQCVAQARESYIYAKGIRAFIEKPVLDACRGRIRDGKISDTIFKDYTRIIPKKVLKRKAEVQDAFDGFVIYHYWNELQKDVKKMSSTEKAKMRDPILFGVIRETNRLYFIDDWEDEYCDLTFDELLNHLGDDAGEITHQPETIGGV